MSLLDEALAWHALGFAPVPITTDGQKRPAVLWEEFIAEPPTRDEVEGFFARVDTDGIGLICGRASGGLEMFEVEGRARSRADDLGAMLAEGGFGDLWARLQTGYVEDTPSGGRHWYYRVTQPRPNTKLARTPDRLPVFETRGEGGFTVVAPSAGRSHPSGGAWTVTAGARETVPLLTPDERDALYAIAATFDESPQVAPLVAAAASANGAGSRPGDEFNARATWDDILGSRGWVRSKAFGRGCGWTRPGKSAHAGISATTGTSADGADRLYVFSTSTEFESERPYSKFAAYTLLEHAGDWAAAAKALAGQGYGRAAEEPRPALATFGADGTPPQPHAVVASEPPTYTLTDDGNALRLADAHAADLRFCCDWGRWLAWDGHRWRRDSAGDASELARGIARGLPDGKGTETHRKWSLSARGIAAMLKVASTDPRLVVSADRLDADPYALNTPAGVVSLRTGEVSPSDPAALHTRTTACAPSMESPERFLRFLADTFAGDAAVATYVQRLLGISAVGTVLEPTLPFAYGSGANGKSTLLSIAEAVLGRADDGYSAAAPADLLLATAHPGHPTEIARLAGVRLVVASELEDGQRFAEAKIKWLTGKDTLTGRFMGRDFFSFAPSHTIWLLGNEQPAVRAGGPAFWRRIRLIPFLHVVPIAQRIADLDEQLIADEGPQILGWIIRGAVDYLREGLPEPDAVRAATARYEHDQDHLARFVEECCETGEPGRQGMQVAVAALRARYESWCRAEGEQELSAKALTTRLRDRFGVQAVRSRVARIYDGICVTDDEANLSRDLADGLDDGREDWWRR